MAIDFSRLAVARGIGVAVEYLVKEVEPMHRWRTQNCAGPNAKIEKSHPGSLRVCSERATGFKCRKGSTLSRGASKCRQAVAISSSRNFSYIQSVNKKEIV